MMLDLRLRGVDGAHHTVASLTGRTATVVAFVSNGCPTVRAYEDRLKTLQATWRAQGVNVIAINANNPYLSPPDTFGETVKRARERQYNFSCLKDEQGEVAKAFGAICTPHVFVLDDEQRIVYRGRIDDSRLGNTITRRDLENAIVDLVAGRPVAVAETDPFGCSIVW